MIEHNDSEHPYLIRNLKGHHNEIKDIAFHPNVAKIGSCSDKSLFWWSFGGSVQCFKVTGHSNKINMCDFSPSGQFIATASTDETVRIWTPKIVGKCTSFRGHSAPIQCVSFSPCNREIITGANDKTIKIWNLQRKEFLASLVGHNHWVLCARYTSDGKKVISCSDDRTLRVWDPKNGIPVHTFPILGTSGCYVAVHPNDVSVAIALNNGNIRIYDIRNQKLQQQYASIHDKANCVDWHPNGLYLLSCGREGSSKIIDVMEGRPLYTVKGHAGSINVAKFSADGEHFATGGSDKILMIWKTGLLLQYY